MADRNQIVIDGTDANDHGSASGGVNQGGWRYMQKVLEAIAPQVANGKKVVVDLGTEPGTQARNAIDSAFGLSSLPGAGWTIVHVNGAKDIGTFLTGGTVAGVAREGTGILYLPSAGGETSGDLSADELAVINANAAALGQIVNVFGAGLFAMTEEGAGQWGWLRSIIATITPAEKSDTGLTLTAAGRAAFPGLTDADLSTGPWHNYFTGQFASLKVLATGRNGEVVILGGVGVTTVSLATLSVNPGAVFVGQNATGKVTISAAAPSDTVIRLSSNNPTVVVPATVVIPSGQSSATFTITAGPVSTKTTATLSATFAGETRAATLTINPVVDLQVSTANAPAETFTGQTFEVTWTSVNAGQIRANGPWVDRVYLSADAQPSSDDRLLAELSFAQSLDPGRSVQQTQTVSIPRTAIAADGDYFLVVITDASNSVQEVGFESNNFRAVPIRVRLAPLPDLVVEAVDAPISAFFGQTITVEWTVRNVGQGATEAPEWYDLVFLSSDQTPDEAGVERVEVRTARRLEAGQSYTNSASLRVPPGLTGSYFLVVRVDSRRLVDEDNDTNNVSARPIELLRPVPNLVVTDLSVPSAAAPLASVNLSWRVRNAGLGVAQGGWTDRVYFSRNRSLDESAIPIGSAAAPVGALRENETYGQTLHVALPRLAPGGYFLLVQTDADKVLAETEEADNTQVVPLELLDVNPLVAAPGQTNLVLQTGVPTQIEVDLANLGEDALANLKALVEGGAPNITVQVDVPPALGSRESKKARIIVTATDESVLQSALVVRFSGSDSEQG